MSLFENEHIISKDESFLEHQEHGLKSLVHVETFWGIGRDEGFFDELDELLSGFDFG